ncbi:MAG: Porphobilinogen deaminase [Verrucomicrobiales bacterium]|nr:Porphobilinogen deaminase [Verrucomicrobiales bacterium]
MPEKPIIIATRGSALALAQANKVLADCRQKFPDLAFEIRIIKTTGDKLQTASMARIDSNLPRGLFTKELEVALLEGSADFAVHSLKDLPTELPPGLILGAVGGQRADVRDVLIYRDGRRGFKPGMALKDFPAGAVVATSSTRRKAQLLALKPNLKVIEIRGNVATRLQKLADNPDIDATVLAAAGLGRLHFTITPDGRLIGNEVPDGTLAALFDAAEMLPCVGQGAIGLETREGDTRIAKVVEGLNHRDTFQCITAERALLRGMGGGCQTPIGAYAEVVDGKTIYVRAVSFMEATVKRAEGRRSISEAAALGEELAAKLKC